MSTSIEFAHWYICQDMAQRCLVLFGLCNTGPCHFAYLKKKNHLSKSTLKIKRFHIKTEIYVTLKYTNIFLSFCALFFYIVCIIIYTFYILVSSLSLPTEMDIFRLSAIQDDLFVCCWEGDQEIASKCHR